MDSNLTPVFDTLLTDVSRLIKTAKHRLAITVNTELTMLYWSVGKRINEDVLEGKRADYGKGVLSKLSDALTLQYGKGWSEPQLRKCARFALIFPDERILYSLNTELTWTHITQLLFMDDPLKREFYIQLCKLEHWSVRQLKERINSMLYERTAISKKPDESIKRDLQKLKEEKQLSADLVFRDPYFLDL